MTTLADDLTGLQSALAEPKFDESDVAKISRLLRQAESTPYEGEAETFMARAQTLATRHSIDLAMARAHSAKAEAREVPEHRAQTIGVRGQRNLQISTDLYAYIASLFDVKAFVSTDHTTVYPMGMPSDLDLVDVIFSSLVVQMTAAANAFIKAGTYKSEVVWRKTHRRDDWGDYAYLPVDGRTARRSFLSGFSSRIYTRLRTAVRETTAEAETEFGAQGASDESGAVVSVAVVLREKRAEVDAFVKEEYERRNVRVASRRTGSDNYSASSASAGRAAADRARVGSTRQIGR